jgi:O-succinylbenzoic acid--CoA ligase
LFISGGENIQPEEIESVLLGVDGVTAATVVPIDDDEYGKQPVAFVELAGGLTQRRIRSLLEEELPRFKIPVAFWHYPEAGDEWKPSRSALTELANDPSRAEWRRPLA